MIALVNPRSARWKHRIPLSILSLAAVLEGRHAYELIDGNIDGNVRERLLTGIRDRGVRYVGISVMPGPAVVTWSSKPKGPAVVYEYITNTK